MNERTLLRRARLGDEAAIEALYRRHAPRVLAAVRRIARDDAMAEDWAQEAWIRALRGLPGFRGDAAFGTWIHRVAVNTALDQRRRRRPVELRHPAAPEDLAVRDRSPLQRLMLAEAVAALPEGMRTVLVLYDVEGYTHEEIGARLGIAEGTSKSQLHRARARLRAGAEAA